MKYNNGNNGNNGNNVLLDIYNRFSEIQRETNKIKILTQFSQDKIQLLDSSLYLPEKIKNWINTNIKYSFILSYKYNSKNINIKFYSDVLNIINNFDIYKTILIINFLISFSKKNCSKNMNIDIYLTPFKKYFDENLTPYHINTGYSTIGCKDNSYLTIYRYEEWFKVLIHELVHNLDLDFSTENIKNVENKMQIIFEYNCLYNFFESYCEIWARILNVCICCLFDTNNKFNKFDKFKNLFKKKIKVEQEYSIIQSKFILNYLNKNKVTKNKFINNNIFSYYVITSLLLVNYDKFFKFCTSNNINLIKFQKKAETIHLFLILILQNFDKYLKILNSEKYLDIEQDKSNLKSLRMSINQINN